MVLGFEFKAGRGDGERVISSPPALSLSPLPRSNHPETLSFIRSANRRLMEYEMLTAVSGGSPQSYVEFTDRGNQHGERRKPVSGG